MRGSGSGSLSSRTKRRATEALLRHESETGQNTAAVNTFLTKKVAREFGNLCHGCHPLRSRSLGSRFIKAKWNMTRIGCD
jgi:hypothetical protein